MRLTTRAARGTLRFGIPAMLACAGLGLAACHGYGNNGVGGQAGAPEATLAHGGERGAVGGGPSGRVLAGQEPRGLNYATAAAGNGHAANVPEATLREMQAHSEHPPVDEPGPGDNHPGDRAPHSAGVLQRATAAP